MTKWWLIFAAAISFALLLWLWNAERYSIVPAPRGIDEKSPAAWRIDRRTGAVWFCQVSCAEGVGCAEADCTPVQGNP